MPMIFATDSSSYRRHRDVHPAFFGSLDWHSSVLMHWVLVRLLRQAGELVPADEIRSCLSASLTTENLLVEAEFFADGFGRNWERPYG
jgi:hypothetical protein